MSCRRAEGGHHRHPADRVNGINAGSCPSRPESQQLSYFVVSRLSVPSFREEERIIHAGRGKRAREKGERCGGFVIAKEKGRVEQGEKLPEDESRKKMQRKLVTRRRPRA